MFLSGIALMAVRQWRIIEARGADRNFNFYEADHGSAQRRRLRGVSVPAGSESRFRRSHQRWQRNTQDSRRVWFARQVWGRPRHLLLPKNVSADLTPKQVGAVRQG